MVGYALGDDLDLIHKLTVYDKNADFTEFYVGFTSAPFKDEASCLYQKETYARFLAELYGAYYLGYEGGIPEEPDFDSAGVYDYSRVPDLTYERYGNTVNLYKIPGFTMVCYKDSTAEAYALEHGFDIEYICDEHAYTGAVTTPATHLTEGVMTYTCDVCGDAYTEAIEKTAEHSHTATVTTPATHLTEGVMTCTCACGDSYTEVIAKTAEHSYEAVVIAPTCIEKGFTTYTCACGDSYKDSFTALAGHKDADGDEFCDFCDKFLGEKDDSSRCTHMCHKDGFMGFIWKIVKFFWKLFGMNPVCECGAAHY